MSPVRFCPRRCLDHPLSTSLPLSQLHTHRKRDAQPVMLLLRRTCLLLFPRPSALPPTFLRLLSTLGPPSNRQLLEEYLVNSCEFSLAEATRATKQILRPINSLSNPQSVVEFLRKNGLDSAQVRAAVLRDPRLLLLSVNDNLKPRMKALESLGFSLSDIKKKGAELKRKRSDAGRSGQGSFLELISEIRTDHWISIRGSVTFGSSLLFGAEDTEPHPHPSRTLRRKACISSPSSARF